MLGDVLYISSISNLVYRLVAILELINYLDKGVHLIKMKTWGNTLFAERTVEGPKLQISKRC